MNQANKEQAQTESAAALDEGATAQDKGATAQDEGDAAAEVSDSPSEGDQPASAEDYAADPSAESVADLPPKLSVEQIIIKHLKAEIVQKDDKLTSYITAYRQAMADVEREKDRLARERSKVLDRERMDLCAKFLEVLDNLERSRAGCEGAGSVDELSQGLDMVTSQFLAALESAGVRRMTTLGEDFDHNLHEASGMIPLQGDQRDQEVVFEERAGYLFGEQLLRAARVVVAAAAD